jgi:hypothetical protein
MGTPSYSSAGLTSAEIRPPDCRSRAFGPIRHRQIQGARHHELPVAAVFIVDAKGEFPKHLPAADVVKAAEGALR